MKKVVSLVINDLSYDQRMQRICGTLASSGYDVTLVGRELPESVALTGKPFNQKRLKCRFKKGPFFYLEYNLRLFFLLFRLKPEIINSVDADTLFAVRMYRFFAGFIWIHDAHELFPEVPEVVNRRWVKKLWTALEKHCLPLTDSIYTVSNSVADYYREISGKEVYVIRNVPDALPDRESEEVKKVNPPVLIYQGALNEGRCIEMYIEMMHDLEAQLWLVGEGDLSAELREQVKRENVSDKVKFFGRVEPRELKKLTQQACIGLNVLEPKGLSYLSSLSNKCFDYIQAGIPSVHSAFPEYLALDKEYHIFRFAEANPRSILDETKLLLNDHDLYKSLRDNCNIASDYLVWTAEKEKLVAIYDKTG
ncbi:MAG: glycosyltransferase [Bacteroidetes bacterium]|nr:glycosyltransferase [Bacteroidota bacterium]